MHTPRPSKNHTLVTTELFRGFGTLIPPTDLIPAGLEPSKLNLDTSKYLISRRQVYLLSLRKGLINGYDMFLTNQ